MSYHIINITFAIKKNTEKQSLFRHKKFPFQFFITDSIITKYLFYYFCLSDYFYYFIKEFPLLFYFY